MIQSIGTQQIAMTPAMMDANRFTPFASTTDGLSNTLLMIEDAGRPYRYGRGFTKRGPDSDGNDSDGGWGDPDSWVTIHGADPNLGTQKSGPTAVNGSSDNEIYGFHPGGANILIGDGSVRILKQSVSLAMVSAFVSRQGGEILPAEVQ